MKSRGQRLHRDLVDTYGGMIRNIEQELRLGRNVPDCLSKAMIEAQKEEELGHLDMAILASAFMIGGVETVCTRSHPVENKCSER